MEKFIFALFDRGCRFAAIYFCPSLIEVEDLEQFALSPTRVEDLEQSALLSLIEVEDLGHSIKLGPLRSRSEIWDVLLN